MNKKKRLSFVLAIAMILNMVIPIGLPVYGKQPKPSVNLSITGTPMLENGGTATITGTLSSTVTTDVTFTMSFSGTAEMGTDYTVSETEITIPANSTTGSVILTAVNDTKDEENETVIAEITSVTNGIIGTSNIVTATITDDDSSTEDGLSVFKKAYIPLSNSSKVAVLNTETNEIEKEIAVGSLPLCGVFNTSKKQVWVSNHSGGTISVIDLNTDEVIKTITGFSVPTGITFNKDGSKAYVCGYGETLYVVDATTYEILNTITLSSGAAIQSVIYGDYLYVTHNGKLSKFDINTLELVEDKDYSGSMWNVIVNPQNKKLYFGSRYGSTVWARNLDDNTEETMTAGNYTQGMEVSPDGSRLYVANYSSKSVSVIDTSTNTVIHTIDSFAGFPVGIGVSIDGNQIYVVNGSYLSIYNAIDFSLVKEVTMSGACNFVFGSFMLTSAVAAEVPGLTTTKEEQTNIQIDFENEVLTGFTTGSAYTMNLTTTTPDSFSMDIDEDWFGSNLSIVKNGNGTTTTDSDAQNLLIPARPEKPSAEIEISKSTNSIAVMNTDDFTGCEYSIDGTTWKDTSAFTGLESGTEYTIYIRKKATDSSFSSLSAETTAITDGNDESTRTISGTVTDEDVNGISGVTVKITKNGSKGTVIKQTITDENGDFTISGIPNGTYSIVVEKDGQIITKTLLINQKIL